MTKRGKKRKERRIISKRRRINNNETFGKMRISHYRRRCSVVQCRIENAC